MNVHRSRSTVMPSREFNQDTAKAKRAAEKGPVFVTTRGIATHVLLTKAEYDRLAAAGAADETKEPFVSLAEALADPSPEADFDFEVPEFKAPFKGFQLD
ncbi:MAG: type II toxin-antitoxin system Phd/YefM family antitoxin [Rhizobiaceae bacterium]|nr:type II toxin-antitoxin system Phd/YefM family antitoxin [Rhizobiaceae bacterium]